MPVSGFLIQRQDRSTKFSIIYSHENNTAAPHVRSDAAHASTHRAYMHIVLRSTNISQRTRSGSERGGRTVLVGQAALRVYSARQAGPLLMVRTISVSPRSTPSAASAVATSAGPTAGRAATPSGAMMHGLPSRGSGGPGDTHRRLVARPSAAERRDAAALDPIRGGACLVLPRRPA